MRRKRTKKETKVSKKASKPTKQTKPSKKGLKKPNRLSDILKPEALEPDASVSKDDEIFGQLHEIQSEVIDFLCPKGVTLDVQEELMESATDVCALPGKVKGYDASSTMEALGATLSDMNSRNARRKKNTRTAPCPKGAKRSGNRLPNMCPDAKECGRVKQEAR